MGATKKLFGMPRKLVKIGEVPQMPTIKEFLTEMAERQRDEIQRLKQEALGKPVERNLPEPPPDKLVPDPWQFHPVKTPSANGTRRSKAANSTGARAAGSPRKKSPPKSTGAKSSSNSRSTTAKSPKPSARSKSAAPAVRKRTARSSARPKR